MSVFAIRHGLSEANNLNNLGSLAFAAEEAPLMELGREQAREAGRILLSEYGMNPSSTQAATSQLLRTKQTALEAGFAKTVTYSSLNEVKHQMDLKELRAMLDGGELPRIAIIAAEAVLANPPHEKVWFTHGLQIAGLCAILAVHQDKRLIPKFCEIRELSI